MKKILLIALSVIIALPVVSLPVSETDARLQAQMFLQQRGKSLAADSPLRTAVRGRRAAAHDSHSSYYVFNVTDGEGFVIVSGDSRTTPILGYADQGSIVSGNMPDGLRFLLDIYAEEMDALGEAEPSQSASRRAASHRAASATRQAIAPFVLTHWDQVLPYNSYCPTINDENTVTGCVATSMAQVMYYHQWPSGLTTTIPGYTTRNGKCTVAELPAATFDWTSMSATYSKDFSGTDAETAVAKLMQYCGTSLQMNYNVSSSSAYNASIADALKTHFGYDATYAQRQYYTYTEWVDMVYSELASGRPVVLGGQATGGGHSFVCDGYDTDDYFHINWGWSGSSDGFFRLSVLDPYEQGIGGSSSLDGFSFTQDAVIGISPRSAGTAPVCLSLEKLQFDEKGTTATKVLTRASADDAFTSLPLYVILCNYSFITTAYDYEVVITDGTTTTVLDSSTAVTMTFNTNETLKPDLDLPAAIADGTYTIKVLSRANGQTDWQECYDGPQQQLTAVVEGNTMTVTAPIVSGTAALPAGVSFSVEGNQTKGYEQTVTASVTGGTVDYYGNLVLRVNKTAVMGKSVEIPAGETVDVRFSYIPTASGNDTLTLYNARTGGKQIGSYKIITIAESDATNNLDLNFAYTIDNQTAGGQLYGNAFRATVTVINPSADSTYVGQLNCSARQWTKTEETVGDETTTTWSWESLGVTKYPLTVEKNGSTVIQVAADDLPAEGYYSFRLTYRRVANDNTVADAVHIGLVTDDPEHGSLTITDGYRLGDATGAMTIHEPSTTIDAGDACFADLRSLSTLSGVTVTRSTNPNCLYLLPDGSDVPDGLSGCNVVCGTTAQRLTLTDGNNFYSPIAFTAAEASYTRTFTLPAAGISGWTTLMLPFTVTTVTVTGDSPVEKTWFRSDDDEDGSFWLRAFTADAEGTVTFGHAQQLLANTPYIIAVPGDAWGDEWQMTDRPVTFSATDAAITATAAASVTGNNYKFCGTTAATTVTDAYVLNGRGSRFVKTTAATAIAPFRAWFEAVSISSLTLPALAIGSSSASDILQIENRQSVNSKYYYTLDGRRLSAAPTAPGLYIHNGKAIIIK